MVERGSYKDLKARQINFSAWVSDLAPIEDDPTGVLDRGFYLILLIQVNEIKLENASPFTQVPAPLNPINPLYPGVSGGRLVARKLRKPSPLANVINAEEEVTLLEPNQATIRQIIDLNAGSSQTSRIDEATISKMIERNQSNVLTGNPCILFKFFIYSTTSSQLC